MPVFISYSHSDSDFVDKLALQLVAHKTHIWLDKWEMRVGDSLIEKIQNAVQGASALVVVLSKKSVASEWCKREINSGLLRELEEKRVVVLPVRVDSCEVPIFVRGKLYADFRTNFDDGFRQLFEGIAPVISDSLGRIEQPDFHTDWGIDWGLYQKTSFYLRITMVEQANEQPYSCLTEICIYADQRATKLYETDSRLHSPEFARLKILKTLTNEISAGLEIRLVLTDQFPRSKKFQISNSMEEAAYYVTVTAKRLGEDTGKGILLDVGGQLKTIEEAVNSVFKS